MGAANELAAPSLKKGANDVTSEIVANLRLYRRTGLACAGGLCENSLMNLECTPHLGDSFDLEE